MGSISLYQPNDTFVHRLNPINKILYVVAVVVFVFAIPEPKAHLASLFLQIVVLWRARVIRNALPLAGYSSVILLSVLIVQGLYLAENQTPLLILGPVTFYKEGVIYALKLGLRVMNILSVFAILILTTKPSDMIACLILKGMSPKIGYLLSSVLQIIPQMLMTVQTILDAQRARGMEVDGRLSKRIKAFIPLVGPFITGSLMNAKERAMALEVRGFNVQGGKTSLTEFPEKTSDKVAYWSLIFALTSIIVWRLFS